MAQPLTLIINNQNVTPYAEWPAAQIVVQRDVEALTLAVELQKVKLLQDARDAVMAAGLPPLGIPISVQYGGVVFQGRIFPGQIWYGRDYLMVNAQLDTAGYFARLIEGRLIEDSWRKDVKVVVSPRVDKATILALSVGIVTMVYMTVRETIELIKDISTGIGVAGAGVGGPISSAIMMVVYFAVRIIFIALMVVAIINLIKQIKDLLQRTITVRALRLSDALQNFAAAAGFQVSGMPGWFQRTWLLGGGVEQYEAGELFRLAKQLSRTVLFVQGNAIHFISTSATFPQQYRVAYEEFYRHNLDELRRRTLISLVRDTSDEHTRNVVTAAEIDRQGLVGLERVDIPYAPATRLGKLPAEKTIMAFVHALKVFGSKFSNVSMALKNLKDYPVVEREQFLPKLYVADNPQKVKDSTAKETLEHIAGNYTTYGVRRVYESVRMPMTAATFQALMAQGFPGVRSLRWRVADTAAEVEYEVADTGVPLNIVINYV